LHIDSIHLAPLEWHGPHLPVGLDEMHAAKVCEELAEIIGGLVYPTTYLGTETRRNTEELRDLGFKGDESITGMDFPSNSIPSIYIEESVFGVIVKEIIRLLKKMQFKAIFLISGHGAVNQNKILSRIALENSDQQCQVVFKLVFPHINNSDLQTDNSSSLLGKNGQNAGLGIGHASKDETSITLHLHPELVDLHELPDISEKIFYRDWGIVDGPAFAKNPTADYSIRPADDPRQATAEHGRIFLAANLKILAVEIKRFLWQNNIVTKDQSTISKL
jgi:creatinine amidohydrolase/Fe(II)-dependent formamide hydrolase-like protein